VSNAGTSDVGLPAELAALVGLGDPDLLTEAVLRADPVALQRLAELHRLTGRLATALDDLGDPRIPRSLLARTLQVRTHTATSFAERRRPQLEQLVSAMSDAGVRPTVLKGAALVLSGIVPVGHRPMADLDVLVSRCEVDVASAALTAIGYRPRTQPQVRRWARTHHYQDPPLFHPRHAASVDLHWHVQVPAHRHGFDPDALRRVPLYVAPGAEAYRLADPDQFVHLALHLWYDRSLGRPGALGQLWDVVDVGAALDRTGWHRVAQLARRIGASDRLAAVVALGHLLLEAPLPPELPAAATAAEDPRLHSFALTRVLAPRPDHLQLLMVTPDVAYRPTRQLTRVLAVMRTGLPAGTADEEPKGSAARSRARLAHVRWVLGLLARAVRSPRTTRVELVLDRWAHELA
jgi:hypothetical protein